MLDVDFPPSLENNISWWAILSLLKLTTREGVHNYIVWIQHRACMCLTHFLGEHNRDMAGLAL